ncbi:hypothetical protein ACHAXA_007742 [Cyclostephanos tholiformis]|uniref:TLC domain-containing protein n=1 Tax=Cyclostephanos tholiformis TaxID=382380 RepID=A0ABD3RY89_9STRA
MCRLPAPPKNPPPPRRQRRSSSFALLLTHDSFVFPHLDDPDKDDDNKRHPVANVVNRDTMNKDDAAIAVAAAAPPRKNPHLHGLGGPSLPSTLLTVAFYVASLFLVEYLARYVIGRFAHVDPILEVEIHRHILARHLAVDFFALVVCAYVAISNRRVCAEIISHGMSFAYGNVGTDEASDDDGVARAKEARGKKGTIKKTTLMCESRFEERIFKYHPGSQRLVLLFFVYQVKNMHDTIYWNDGIEFVLHHILAGMAAWGGMYPGCCHFYALFYFGFSEISTAVLCLLANFDPVYGIPGLGDAFPKTKLILGALFVISFVICRLVLWPFTTYYFARDTMMAIKSDVPRANGRRGYLWIIYCCCVGLSLIQLLFVVMIVKTGKEEIAKFMNS